MKSAKIKDIFNIDTSSKLRAKDAIPMGAYPFYTSGNNIKYLDTYQFNTKGIVIGKGGKPNWHLADGQFSISSDCCLLTTKKEFVDVEYVYYYLCAKPNELGKHYKGIGLKHISIYDIRDIQIEYPELATQKIIITVLSFLDDIIKRRNIVKEELSKVIINYYLSVTDKANGLEEYKVRDVALEVKSGPFGSNLKKSQIKESGDIYVLGIENVKNGIVEKQSATYLPLNEQANYRRYIVKDLDILVSLMGSVGYSAVVPENFGLAISTKHLADITVNKELCNPYFLSYCLANDPYIKAQFKSCKRGVIMDGVTLNDIKNLKIKLPSQKAQKRFEQIYLFYKSIDNKMVNQISLLEELRSSLLKHFFVNENSFISTTNKEQHNKDSNVANIIRLIEQGAFVDLANYDEMRMILYNYIDKGVISQKYDEKKQTIKLYINETHKP